MSEGGLEAVAEAAGAGSGAGSGAGETPLDFPALDSRAEALRQEHAQYLAAHPELKALVADFLSETLIMKPSNVRAFAREFFSGKASKVAKAAKDAVHALRPLILCGPSGVGKGTLVKRLLADFGNHFGLSVSHTTRSPREGEENGKHYHFTDHETMRESINNGHFLEFAEVHSNLYGTSFQAVHDVSAEGKVCILEIDIQGLKNVRKTALKPYVVYIAPPSFEQLEERLRSRGTETEEALATRLANAREEMLFLEGAGNSDSIVVNDDLDKAYEDLKTVLAGWYPEASLLPKTD